MIWMNNHKENMNIVIVGHVDHGKSTVIGRLLADTNSLPEGKLAFIKEKCRRNAKPFEYAFLIDALKEEQSQGITIDSARCFFRTKRRNYTIIDAPGHIEFLRNMVTGAARADAALMVIDAAEGVRENSKRHGYILSLLGIKQVAVLINKMDLVAYQETAFNKIVKEYKEYLAKIGIEPTSFIPISGSFGDNIAGVSERTPWYRGDQTVLAVLDRFRASKMPEDKPFRMPVQGIYKFTRDGDNRRIIAGTITSGVIKVGDEVVFYPSGKKSTVASLEAFNKAPQSTAHIGCAVGFTLTEQVYVTRGELAALADQPKPKVTSRIKANLFWLGKNALEKKKNYLLKIGTAKVGAKLEKINKVMDAATLGVAQKDKIDRHEVAECILKLERAVALDLVDEMVETGRFVLVDDYEIAGGGIIQEALADEQSKLREQVILRNYKWEKSIITPEARAEKYNQRATLVLITGRSNAGKKAIAKALEKRLFDDGKLVYFLGIGNVLYGVDADIKGKLPNEREEHLRRLAEVAHIMLDAGAILVVTAVELSQDDLEIVKTIISPDKIKTIWVGEPVTTDVLFDLHLTSFGSTENAISIIKDLLQEKSIIFKP